MVLPSLTTRLDQSSFIVTSLGHGNLVRRGGGIGRGQDRSKRELEPACCRSGPIDGTARRGPLIAASSTELTIPIRGRSRWIADNHHSAAQSKTMAIPWQLTIHCVGSTGHFPGGLSSNWNRIDPGHRSVPPGGRCHRSRQLPPLFIPFHFIRWQCGVAAPSVETGAAAAAAAPPQRHLSATAATI